MYLRGFDGSLEELVHAHSKSPVFLNWTLRLSANERDYVAANAGTGTVVGRAETKIEKVIAEANKRMFKPLNARFFPAILRSEELYSPYQRRNISQVSVNEGFLDSFMEPCVSVAV